MAEPDRVKESFRWRTLARRTGIVWAVAMVGVCVVCVALQRMDQLATSALIGTLSFFIALVAMMPLAKFSAALTRPETAAQFIPAAMLSSAIRLSMTILLVVMLDKTATAPRQTVGLWAIFWYSLLMATELVPIANLSTGGRLSFRRSDEEPGAR